MKKEEKYIPILERSHPSFINDLDKEVRQAGDEFINNLKSGKIYSYYIEGGIEKESSVKKEYPLNKVAESFKQFITTDVSKKMSEID